MLPALAGGLIVASGALKALADDAAAAAMGAERLGRGASRCLRSGIGALALGVIGVVRPAGAAFHHHLPPAQARGSTEQMIWRSGSQRACLSS